MAWVTRIGPSLAQVEYRLTGGHGCGQILSAAQAAALLAHQGLEGSAETSGVVFTDGGADGQVEYRLGGAERPLIWIGNGLREFGIEPNTVMAPGDYDKARRMMQGLHASTGEVLVEPKTAVAPQAKVKAAPLLAEVRRVVLADDPRYADLDEADREVAADASGLDDRAASRLSSRHQRDLYLRIVRQVARRGELHRVPAHELGKLAASFDLDVRAVYGGEYEAALRDGYELVTVTRSGRSWQEYRPKKVVVGNLGFDFGVNLPKGHSVLLAYGDATFAAAYDRMLTEVAHEGIYQLEDWVAYAMRGHHGGVDEHGAARHAERVDTSGFLGWATIHRAARPVGDAPVGDPHWHVHYTLANMVRGVDGNWSTVAAGGRDLYRHALATDAYIQARTRHEAYTRYGITFTNTAAGVWEIEGVPYETLRRFSKRDTAIRELFSRLNLRYDEASLRARRLASAKTREAKRSEVVQAEDDVLRAFWQGEGRAGGDDPDAIIAAVLGLDGPGGPAPGASPSGGPDGTPGGGAGSTEAVHRPSVEDIAAAVFDPESGLTAHGKRFEWPRVYAAVLDQLPTGVASREDAIRLTNDVLACGGYAVRLPPKGPQHVAHPQRYTTHDILTAEETILAAARAGYAANVAVVSQRVADMSLAMFEAIHRLTLSDEQRATYSRLVRAGHGVDAVIGVAGAGKSTVMAAVRLAFEAEGLRVAGTSTAAIAVENLRRRAGLGEARTIAGYLHSIDTGAGLHGIDVLLVDEAAMADDRDMARLLAHARMTGTKVIGIGDPHQLRSPGVGGTFPAVHTIVGGTILAENRRQKDEIERRAVALLRDGERVAALRLLAAHGRVHATRTRDDALATILLLWQDKRQTWPDPHDLIDNLLMLAARNADVDQLNLAARALRRESGELDHREVEYRLPGEATLHLAVGDIILVRKNRYLSQENPADHDVLNGFRAVVTNIDADRNVTIAWRERDLDGNVVTLQQRLDVDFVSGCGISHGLAITGHKSQGLEAEINLTFANGMRANAYYAAQTRSAQEGHTVLSLDEYESDEIRAQLGEADTAADMLDRAIVGFNADLAQDEDEDLVITEFGMKIAPVGPDAARVSDAGGAVGGDADEDRHAAYPDLLAGALGTRVADSVLEDPAWPALRHRLAAAEDEGHDLSALLHLVVHDPDLPDLRNAQSVTRVLCWRIDRQRDAVPVSAPLLTLTPPADPATERLVSAVSTETWTAAPSGGGNLASTTSSELAEGSPAAISIPTAAETEAAVRTGTRPYAHLSDQGLSTALDAAERGAYEAARRAAYAETRAANLDAAARHDQGPAVRAVRGLHDNLADRGRALHDLLEVARETRTARAQHDALAAQLAEVDVALAVAARPGARQLSGLDPTRLRAQRDLLHEDLRSSRRRLDQLAARRLDLDQRAGDPASRVAVLRQWTAISGNFDERLANARLADGGDAAQARAEGEQLRYRAGLAATRLDDLRAERAHRRPAAPPVDAPSRDQQPNAAEAIRERRRAARAAERAAKRARRLTEETRAPSPGRTDGPRQRDTDAPQQSTARSSGQPPRRPTREPRPERRDPPAPRPDPGLRP